MTNEEAIAIIEHRDDIMDYCESRQLAEALDVAVEALKVQPCEDAVRRETVRDMFCEIHCHKERSKCVFRNICKYMNRVSALPPVTPKPTECEDCVSRQAVLDALRTCFDTYCVYDENNGIDYIDYNEAVDEVLDLKPVTPKQEWIHVSEDLPKESGEYLVSVIDEYDENYEAVGVAQYDVKEGAWRELGVDRTVIAWMPKPASYKEGENK